MQRMVLRILATLGLVGVSAIASPALAQVIDPGGEEEPGGACFYCDDGAPCQASQHYDTGSWWFGTLKGNIHENCAVFSCSWWKSDGGHDGYFLEEENFLIAALNVVRDGRDEVLLRFMLEHPQASLNVARSALQVATQHGDVYFHARLEPAQTERLMTALTAASEPIATAPRSAPRTR